jgi:hypothetical protein
MKLIINLSSKNLITHMQHNENIAKCGTLLNVLAYEETEGDIAQVTCKRCLKAYKEDDDK